MTQVNVELYKRLLDILAEYQLPGGKLDGHRLISDLADAKLYRSLREPGYVRVPRTATPRMLAAALGWRERDSMDGLEPEEDMFERAYRAMVAASEEKPL